MKSAILLFISISAFAFSLGMWLKLGISSWSLALLGTGIILVSIEVFLFPGTLFFGIVGFLCLCGGIYGAWNYQLFHQYLTGILLSLFSELIGVGLLFYLLRSSSSIQTRWILNDASPTDGLQETATPRSLLLGKQGISVTELRPAGKIKLDEIFYDVVSTGDFINRGEKVQIIDVSSNRLMVERVEE
ncbi:MAG: NfeD family protein [Planctomycetota bacterium]